MSKFVRLKFFLCLVFVLAACSDTATPSSDLTSQTKGRPFDEIPANDRARGLVYEGLRLGTKGGPCEGLLELDVPGADKVCTHGPDPAPSGVDVLNPAPLSALAPASSADVPCIGDGTSGNRIQAIYAVASDQPDRFDEIAPYIADWAATLDSLVDASAKQVGGERHLRFVTNPNCDLAVERVVVSPAAAADFATMVYEMREQMGYNDPSRKYMVWMDARTYCGIAQVYPDDRPGQDNGSNGRFAMFARVDAGCWATTYSAALHELVHTLGGVQPSAPHGTSRYHCTDDYDNLCYADSGGLTMTFTCPDNEAYLDCNHDDYFHPHPPAGSYLAEHWNVANSSFLQGGSAVPTNQPPVVDAGADQTIQLPSTVTLQAHVTDDGRPVGSLTNSWSQSSGSGTVSFSDASALTTGASFSAEGIYTLKLTSSDGELSASDTMTVNVRAAPENKAPVVVAGPDLSIGLSDTARLEGSVSDDGLPIATPINVAWAKVSGPGNVSFGDASSTSTTVHFSAAGTYVLELSADDSEFSNSDTLSVTVSSVSTTQRIASSLNKRNPVRTFEVRMGTGLSKAVLTFEGKRGKKGSNPSLTLDVLDERGNLVSSATGTSPVTLSHDATAGNHSFKVSGDPTSFELELSYSVP